MFVTKEVAQAQEAANVMDYYQNLVRDLQVALHKAIGPIKDTGRGEGFTKKLEGFAADLEKEVEGFGDASQLTADKGAQAKADAIMESKHPSVQQIRAQAPAKTDAQHEATAAQAAPTAGGK